MKWIQIALLSVIVSFASSVGVAQGIQGDRHPPTPNVSEGSDLSDDGRLAHEISDAKFGEAYQRYRSGRRLKTFGVAAIASSTGLLTFGVIVHTVSSRGLLFSEPGKLDQTDRRLRDSMFITAAGFLIGGTVMFKIGHDQQLAEIPTLDAYKAQEQRRHAEEASATPELSVGPLFARGGGGARLMLQF